MAEVYLAKAAGPMGFKKTLMLKRILPHLAEDPAFVEMFLGEARLAAQLEHPNVVQIFDFGEAEGSYFLAMAVPRPVAAVATGKLEFRIRPHAVVSLDGKVPGQTPLAPVEVPEGAHTLRLVNKELGKDVVKTFEVKAGQPNVFKLNLEAE